VLKQSGDCVMNVASLVEGWHYDQNLQAFFFRLL